MGKKHVRKSGTGKAREPKTECCVSKPRCQRCPIRMLKEGTLPEGYTVRKRKLVKVGSKVNKFRKKQPVAA